MIRLSLLVLPGQVSNSGNLGGIFKMWAIGIMATISYCRNVSTYDRTIYVFARLLDVSRCFAQLTYVSTRNGCFSTPKSRYEDTSKVPHNLASHCATTCNAGQTGYAPGDCRQSGGGRRIAGSCGPNWPTVSALMMPR